MAQILSGKPLANEMLEDLTIRAEALKAAGVVPTLAIVRVGNDEEKIAYERGATQRCGKAGIEVRHIVLNASVGEDELVSMIEEINRDDSVHGCSIPLPLPEHINSRRVCDALCPQKDVDAVSSRSLGCLFMGRKGFSPCAAQACINMLDYYGLKIEGRNVCVVGRSLVVGRPVSMLMLCRNATVTVCHTRTENLAEKCRGADILITAAGQAGLISPDYVNQKQIVLDVGINVNEAGKLCGDSDFDALESIVSAITPVPGGIGIVASTLLAQHVIEAAENLSGHGSPD